MKIKAGIQNRAGKHQVSLSTNDQAHTIEITPRASGFGSSANGGELLFLALATCYCNDIYREASKRGIKVEAVEVEVQGDFGAEGEPAKNVTYRAKVTAQASEAAICDMMQTTDRLTEIQNTLRLGVQVVLEKIEAVSTQR
jgi:organic hydroperoxide reductase OsmC/OhrA